MLLLAMGLLAPVESLWRPAAVFSENPLPEDRGSDHPNADAGGGAVPDDVMQPTRLGIRMTPQIAGAMSKRFAEQMVNRYELSDGQAEAVRQIITERIMTFAHENEALGQQMFEFMMANMIEYDGRFPREKAQEFGKLAQPFAPRLKELMTQTTAEIGREMTLSQKLKFTADVTGAAAGITVFEERMKRWAKGDVGDGANPFWDPAENDPDGASTAPEDPNEHPDHREARREVERWDLWEMNLDEGWEKYIERAAAFYGFTDAQRTGAEAILKQCRQRADAIRTPEWQARLKEIRIAQHLIRRADDDLDQSVARFLMEEAHQRLRRPLTDLSKEFEKRINDLADSAQRAAAKEKVRRFLTERGIKEPPI